MDNAIKEVQRIFDESCILEERINHFIIPLEHRKKDQERWEYFVQSIKKNVVILKKLSAIGGYKECENDGVMTEYWKVMKLEENEIRFHNELVANIRTCSRLCESDLRSARGFKRIAKNQTKLLEGSLYSNFLKQMEPWKSGACKYFGFQ